MFTDVRKIIKKILKQIRSRTIDHSSLLRARTLREEEWFVKASAGIAPGSQHTLLLSPSAAGNIGDQAMVEAVFENVPGNISVITRTDRDIEVPEQYGSRVRIIPIPSLTSGKTVRSRSGLTQFIELLNGASSFLVVGADMLDGAYSYRQSVQRTTLATLAAKSGISSRILGFSWNAAPDPRAHRALRAAGRAGVKLFVRDPVSLRRLQEAGIEGLHASSDLVFSARTIEMGEELQATVAPTAPYALVNVNGILGQTGNQTPEYELIVTRLLELGLGVVLVPHDSRPTVDDVAACRHLFKRIKGGNVVLIDRILTPMQIRGLAAGAKLVVTGRMHLAIMSLLSCVPAITLSRQGKVEGLMELFGVPELAIEPTPGFGEIAAGLAERIANRGEAMRRILTSRHQDVIELSLENFR